jgi:hypothetical protein
VSGISAESFEEIGRITSAARPVINNGVLVTLKNGSSWRVTGIPHVGSLTLDYGSRIVAAAGRLTVTVDGTAHELTRGSTVTGAIVGSAG